MKGICLRDHEVKAALAGRLGLLVRMVKPQPTWEASKSSPIAGWIWKRAGAFTITNSAAGPSDIAEDCPIGGVGDRLHGKEPFFIDYPIGAAVVTYKADSDWPQRSWRSAAVMPRWASRLAFEVKAVRVARVQGIQLCECAEAGAPPTHKADNVWDSTETFQRLWNFLHGPGSWNANPWCWFVNVVKV